MDLDRLEYQVNVSPFSPALRGAEGLTLLVSFIKSEGEKSDDIHTNF